MRERETDTVFSDRGDAGRRLGRRLAGRAFDRPLIVLGLPRGGIPVACEVARALEAPVDVLVVRKLGAPFNPELAVGSIASGGVTVYNRELMAMLGLDEETLAPIREREGRELARREQRYRGERPFPDLEGRTVVIVDDGAATGATMLAAVQAVRAHGPRHVVVALPTSSEEAVARLTAAADEVVALSTPDPYLAVGRWYRTFDQLSDEDVSDWLAQAAAPGSTQRDRKQGPPQ